MFGKISRIGAVVLVGVLLAGLAVSAASAASVVEGGQTTGLSQAEIEALGLALNDEYRAWATYDQVIRDLGAILPFTNIVGAEQTHINALVTLFNRYGLQVPPNPWPGNVARFASRPEACAGGVAAEIANVGLYDKLLGTVSHRDIKNVFTNLRAASLTKHLPAFQRCAP